MKNKLFADKTFKDSFLMDLGKFLVLNIVGVSFGYLVKVRGDHNGDNGNLFMIIIISIFFVISLIFFIIHLVKDIKKFKNVSKTKE